jgi:hypothetical protein
MTRGPGPTRVALAATALLLALAPPAAPAPKDGADCRACHSCAKPTREDPCLSTCPRPRRAARPPSGPDVVVLDGLEKMYEPVRFDHRAHSGMTRFGGGCTLCHHHTPEGEEHPACRSCHPADVPHENSDQPGLKGAYHRQCLGCHQEWEGETSCEICHGRKAVGASPAAGYHGVREALQLEELIVFETGADEGDRVPFHHRNHSARYESDCVSCHEDQSCTGCHVQNQTPHPMGSLEDVDLHDACFRCHRTDGATSHAKGECRHCHGRADADLFRHETTGWPLRTYHRDLGCRACHPPWTSPARLDPRCESCHPSGWDAKKFDHAVTAVKLDDVHVELDCSDCHDAGFGPGKPPSCAACHDDDRRFDPKTGFGS